jgi:hypothetical protein
VKLSLAFCAIVAATASGCVTEKDLLKAQVSSMAMQNALLDQDNKDQRTELLRAAERYGDLRDRYEKLLQDMYEKHCLQDPRLRGWPR